MNRAEICIIEGQQGSGKTNTAVAKLVDAWLLDKNTRIFANFHLYGMPYVYAGVDKIVEYLNSNFLSDGWVVIDESYIGGDARTGMSNLTRILTWFGSQIRKRKVHLVLICQHGRMIDWRFKFFMTEHIVCEFNDKTKFITLTITQKGKKQQQKVSYYAPQYWPYYDTNELPQIPETMIAKAMTAAR